MKTKILFTVVLTLSLNVLWGQWVEVVTGYSSSNSFSLLDCPDANTCYALQTSGTDTPKIIKTINGGDTWLEVPNGINIGTDPFGAIECTDPQTCFCVIGGTIYKTTNGGQVWSIVSADKGNGSLKMINSQYGYVLNGGEYKIYKTDDFGNTWNTFSFLSGIPFNIQDVATDVDFITPDIGIMAFAANSHDAQEIYKTIDGGLNWTKKYDSITPPMNYFVRAMDMVTEDVGYILFGTGDVLKTIDGGETWQHTPTYPDGGIDMEFIDENNGYISSTGKMIKTTDGGQTWVEEITPIFSSSREIEIVNYDLVYVGTSSPSILKNTNAGLVATILDLENKQIGKIYPNPINDVIEIDLKQINFNSKFQLFDLLGNVMLTQDLSQGKTTIKRNNIPSGVYLFKIIQNNSVLTTGKLVFS